ncbi:uncharacterized protein EV422DRAFT_514450 [Fimicolochytrium jonesii]|uniref:uncharacterized protein n=1 Tax=Fimicolochytrium jonesii TaxID=1396493 RepID=UPI0022FDBBF3|nr:uncharacterized protein EV422DRAFT_514450 [Fimicolochytrium jonesii]KAI8825858.1 hypothetical protein EV422DRAFT_514450 [Fimicolochytrium jonesii]
MDPKTDLKETKVLKLFANVFDLKPVDHSPAAASRGKSASIAVEEHDAEAPQRILVSRQRALTEAQLLEEVAARCWNITTEYVRLFRASRPTQTEEGAVGEVKKAERRFQDLTKAMGISRQVLDETYRTAIRSANRDVTAFFDGRAGYIHELQRRGVDRVRRAYRERFADAVVAHLYDAQKNRDEVTGIMTEMHIAQVKDMNAHIYELKRECHRRTAAISKLRGNLARKNVLMRRHGVYESELTAHITDDRLKNDDTILLLQRAVRQREEKIALIMEDINRVKALTEDRQHGPPRKRTADRAIAQGESRLSRHGPGGVSAGRRSARQQVSSRFPAMGGGVGLRDYGMSAASSVLFEDTATLGTDESGGSSSAASTTSDDSEEPEACLLDRMMADVTAQYEAQVENLQSTHAARVAVLRRDQELMAEELEMQYRSLKEGMMGEEVVKSQIREMMEREGAVRDVARRLFPRGLQPGRKEIGIQCSLDPFT